MALRHYLLVYDLRNQRLIRHEQFEDGDEAVREYARLESEHPDNRDVEIVLVGADSIETIKRTHAHYFNGDLAQLDKDRSPYLAGA